MTQDTQSWYSVTSWMDEKGEQMEGVQDGGDTCIPMAE